MLDLMKMKVTHIKFKNTPTKPYCYMYRVVKNEIKDPWYGARMNNWEFVLKCLNAE